MVCLSCLPQILLGSFLKTLPGKKKKKKVLYFMRPSLTVLFNFINIIKISMKFVTNFYNNTVYIFNGTPCLVSRTTHTCITHVSRTYVCISGGKKCSLFGKFGVLCFLETPVLRFALLTYYRRNIKFLIFQSLSKL